MKSTQPPPADPNLARFLAELKEIGEEDARLAYLARLMGQEQEDVLPTVKENVR